MAGDYLLDTNIVIALLEREQSVADRVVVANRVAVPVVVLGELYFGAYKSNRRAENIARANNIRSGFSIVPLDEQTADLFGTLKQRLQVQGRPIPDNDIWIAAMALQTGMTLVSRDEHFAHVENLSWEVW
jgi:tRNA(fMet)-specific endonuclease VapC